MRNRDMNVSLCDKVTERDEQMGDRFLTKNVGTEG